MQVCNMNLYINPSLSNRDYGIFRIGGPGLANCMFFAARAVVLAERTNGIMLRPTWERFGIGQWLRRERDKRLYAGLFQGASLLSGLKKMWLAATKKHIAEIDAVDAKGGIIDVRGLGNYFADFVGSEDLVRQYFKNNICPQAIKEVPLDCQNVVAIHVRLGDFPKQYRTDIDWYVKVVKLVASLAGQDAQQKFWLFSDGTDDELKPLLEIPNVERAYFGNALADMVAISRSRLLIGSDSTFSGWGAFLGDVPCIFAHVHYGRVFEDAAKTVISNDIAEIETWLKCVY